MRIAGYVVLKMISELMRRVALDYYVICNSNCLSISETLKVPSCAKEEHCCSCPLTWYKGKRRPHCNRCHTLILIL